MNRIPIIIDVDTGLDDSLALFLAVNSPVYDVLAVTATFGNTTLENALKNTLNDMRLLGRSDIPVAAGASKGWIKPQRTSPHIHGASGVGDYKYPDFESKCYARVPAWDLIYDKVSGCSGRVVFFALGPCTNIATAIRKYPEIKDKLDRIVFMGGGVRLGAAAQCASVNVFHDPDAFHFLMHCGVPFHMCASDHMTDFVAVTPQQARESWLGRNELCDAACEMLEYYHSRTGAAGENVDDKVVMHDPATMMYLMEPDCFYSERMYCDIELKGRYSYGMTVIDMKDVLKKPEEEKNINYVFARPEKADYLAGKFLEGIRNAVK